MRIGVMAGLVALFVAGTAAAQVAPAPAAGSGGGGGVGASVSSPKAPTGNTPPGTPSGSSVSGQIARDSAGQDVIGHTTTQPGPVPGNTGGQGTGSK